MITLKKFQKIQKIKNLYKRFNSETVQKKKTFPYGKLLLLIGGGATTFYFYRKYHVTKNVDKSSTEIKEIEEEEIFQNTEEEEGFFTKLYFF
jgi:hypothetical protein